jgi:serine phosphatase RsbU (regulator of sigma subunit)/HAMP domain-containing protein
MLARFGLRTKLTVTLMMLALIAGIIGVIAIAGFQHLLENTRIIHFEMHIAELSDLILVDVLNLRRFEKDYFLNVGQSDKQADYLFRFVKAEESLKAHTSELLALSAGEGGIAEEMNKSAAVLSQNQMTYSEGFRQVVNRMQETPGVTNQQANEWMTPYKQYTYTMENHAIHLQETGDRLAADLDARALKETRNQSTEVLIAVVIGFVLAVTFGLVAANHIAKPLKELTTCARELQLGNCHVEITYESKDEVGLLAEAFRRMAKTQSERVNVAESIASGNLDVPVELVSEKDTLGKALRKMAQDLKSYIATIEETTAAKERIESELRIARDIQMGTLPKIFPPFPDRSEFEIYATLEPAREVGGDLYDFFFIDNDHLCFAVGDVSGKGVPAALFMAISKTLVKMKATEGLMSDEVLSRVNQDLSVDNPSLMFVTLFLGILNIRTGELDYSNAGHEPPYVIRANGDIEPLELTDGVMLGVENDFVYHSGRIVLKQGETIFVYTDGVTEAMDNDDQLFSDARVQQTLARLKEKEIKDILHGVRSEIEAFTEGTPQSDDITMLALKFYG